MSSVIGKMLQRCVIVSLLLLLTPPVQAEGLRTPEAVAQRFVQAYRDGDAETIVALQFFVDDGRGFAAANRNREQHAWVRQMRDQQMRSYRVDILLARDLWRSTGQPLVPQKKLVVVYESRRQHQQMEETYLIGQQGGLYYLLPVHVGQ